MEDTVNQPLLVNTEVVADYACATGEGPLWHPFEKRLYWTDIPAGRLFRYDPSTELHEQCYSGRPVGGFTIQQDGSLLLFMDKGTIAIWRNGSLTTIVPEIDSERETRFNDVIADPEGRVFCGTLSGRRGNGRLYRLDTDGSIHLLLEDVACANGMAFSFDSLSDVSSDGLKDRSRFYFTDSFANRIDVFDYDRETGALSNRMPFTTIPKEMGFPDGCTIDAEGFLWTAVWGGSMLARINHAGVIVHTVALPVNRPTSLTFAGDNLRQVYVTSEGGNDRANDPLAGSLLRLQSLIAGLPEFLSSVTLAT